MLLSDLHINVDILYTSRMFYSRKPILVQDKKKVFKMQNDYY